MKIYLRKLTNNDTKKQIETTSEAYTDFFGGKSENNDGVSVIIENRNGTKKNTFKISKAAGNANSYRFSSPKGEPTIANFINDISKTGYKANDILKIELKNNKYTLDLIPTENSDYSTWNSMIVPKQNTVIISDENIIDTQGDESETVNNENCLSITRSERGNYIYPLNFIIYGAPGTGKTYSTVEYALSIIDNIDINEFKRINTNRKSNVERYKKLIQSGQIVFTTFHQNYGYEEFVQGLRPDIESKTLSFKTVDGVFKVISDKALKDYENNYVIIIDEINRANISKVLGELITLIEEDKRWGEINEMCATLQSGDVFAVPNNLYIIGTMNSADKSISLIDVALRRRFQFIEQLPDSSVVENDTLKQLLDVLNSKLVDELEGTDLLIGHSYFINKTEKDLESIFNNSIIPLLYEYFYDNRKKIYTLISEIIKETGIKVSIVDNKYGRLRIKDE